MWFLYFSILLKSETMIHQNAIFLNYKLLINEIIEYQMFDSIEKASFCMAFLRSWLTNKRLFCTTIAKTAPKQISKNALSEDCFRSFVVVVVVVVLLLLFFFVFILLRVIKNDVGHIINIFLL